MRRAPLFRMSVCLALLTLALAFWKGWLPNRRFNAAADAAYARARDFASASTTFDDAKRWLDADGFHVPTTGGNNFIVDTTHDANTAHPKRFKTVPGYKRLGEDFFGDRWMIIEFYFTEGGEFLRLEFAPNSRPPPKWSLRGNRPATAPG